MPLNYMDMALSPHTYTTCIALFWITELQPMWKITVYYMMNKMVSVVTEAVWIIFPRWQVSLIPEKRCRLSNVACFVDFSKAFDRIATSLVYAKLQYIGIGGKLFQAIQTIYQDYKCCAKVNGLMTNWFDVNCGLKQGCLLSLMFFNFYINDLVDKLEKASFGIIIISDIYIAPYSAR